MSKRVISDVSILIPIVHLPRNCQQHRKRCKTSLASLIRRILLAERRIHTARSSRNIYHHRRSKDVRTDQHMENIVDEHKTQEHTRNHDRINMNQTQDEDTKAHAHHILNEPVVHMSHGLDTCQANDNPRYAQSVTGDGAHNIHPREILATTSR